MSFPFPSGHLPVRLEWRANPNLLSYCIPMGFMLDRFFPQKTCFLNILPPFWSAQSCATSSKIPPSSDLSQKHSFIHFGKGCLLQMYGTRKNDPQINASILGSFLIQQWIVFWYHSGSNMNPKIGPTSENLAPWNDLSENHPKIRFHDCYYYFLYWNVYIGQNAKIN